MPVMVSEDRKLLHFVQGTPPPKDMRFARNPRTTPHVLIPPRHRDFVKKFPVTVGNFQDNTACPKSNRKPHVLGNHVSWRGFLAVCPILTFSFEFEAFLKFSLTKRFKIKM